MKTVADFKRLMTPGSIWNSTHEFIGEFPRPMTSKLNRKCECTDTVKFGLWQTRPDGTESVSHCDWPKASECTFEGDKITITKDGSVRLTYTRVE